MRSRIAIHIRAPYERIFPLAAEVERWPDRLPHYRYVNAVPDPNGERRFAMGARRGRIPVRWEAIQRLFPEARRIEFVHTGGVTRGMQVAWHFAELDGATEVSIEHELDLGWPLVGNVVGTKIVGQQFIEPIARRTLRCVKSLAEAGE